MTMISEPTVGARSQRRRWILLAGAALVALGSAAGLWWWLEPAPPSPPLPAGLQDAELQQALVEARQQVVKTPRSGAAWGHLGLVLLAHHFDDDAEFCFTEAARLDPRDPRWPYGLGMIVLKWDVERSLPLMQQAVTAADSKPAYRTAMRLQLAEALLQGGHFSEAEAIFREEQRLEPQSPRVALGLGLAAMARGDAEAATKCLLLARATPLARKRATAQLAALARTRGDLRAADAYELEIAQWPDDPPWLDPFLEDMVRVQTGRMARDRQIAKLERQQRFAEAAEICLEQIKEQPTPLAYLGAGSNLARAGDYQRGLTLLRKAIQLEPDSANAHTALAVTVFTRAEKEWHKSPDAPQVKEWFREVIEHARRAAELRPDHGHAYLYWGLSLKYLGEPAQAIAPLRKGVACQPAGLALQLALGEALLEAGKRQEAQTHLEYARLLAPNDSRTVQALQRLSQPK
jgi:protein O-GlcNAc transferase